MARMLRAPRRSGPRPNRGWVGVILTAYMNILASSKVLLATFVPSNPGIDETLLRTVGFLSVASDQSGAAEQQIGAIGMIQATDVAIAAGVASLPDPVTDSSDDGWMWYQSFAQRSDISLTAPASYPYPFDSKAKRILAGTGVAFAVVVANAHATHGFEVALGMRVLAQVRGT